MHIGANESSQLAKWLKLEAYIPDFARDREWGKRSSRGKTSRFPQEEKQGFKRKKGEIGNFMIMFVYVGVNGFSIFLGLIKLSRDGSYNNRFTSFPPLGEGHLLKREFLAALVLTIFCFWTDKGHPEKGSFCVC